jgi:hypothetical protein
MAASKAKHEAEPESAEEKVDARLDNRVGDDRPVRESFPAVPQQIDGPDLAHQAEFTRRYHESRKDSEVSGDRRGMHSPGPHGLSDVEERKGHDRADESGGNAAPDGETGADPDQSVGDAK